MWKAVRRSPAGMLGWVVFMFFVLTGTVGQFATPFDPIAQNLADRLAPPGAPASGGGVHLAGTDQLGRDILSRLIAGGRITLAVGLLTVFVGGTVGCVLGVVAGYYGGWPERLIMRLADIQLAFPFVLLALIVIAVLGPSLVNLILVLAFTSWVDYARVVRGEVLSVRRREFVEAARAIGARDARLLARHVFPNVYTTIIVIATLQLAKIVILEASLSFLGLGVQPPTPDWGRMLAEGRDFVATAWWLAAFPGLAILLLVLSVNLMGDWLGTYLDPRLRTLGRANAREVSA
ncbi:MAG TPA: ABC transporter permease [bacterium]|nr:ABC transporter permease [bacterium]